MARSILAIDDDSDFLDLVRAGLATRGIEVTCCETVARAVEVLADRPFDLVMTDLGLTDEGGLALLERLAETRPEVPVLVVTGHGDAASAARALGAKGVLVKPVDLDELTQAMDAILEADSTE
jgi:DNA-binding NtrC family response regulator